MVLRNEDRLEEIQILMAADAQSVHARHPAVVCSRTLIEKHLPWLLEQLAEQQLALDSLRTNSSDIILELQTDKKQLVKEHKRLQEQVKKLQEAELQRLEKELQVTDFAEYWYEKRLVTDLQEQVEKFQEQSADRYRGAEVLSKKVLELEANLYRCHNPKGPSCGCPFCKGRAWPSGITS